MSLSLLRGFDPFERAFDSALLPWAQQTVKVSDVVVMCGVVCCVGVA